MKYMYDLIQSYLSSNQSSSSKLVAINSASIISLMTSIISLFDRSSFDEHKLSLNFVRNAKFQFIEVLTPFEIISTCQPILSSLTFNIAEHVKWRKIMHSKICQGFVNVFHRHQNLCVISPLFEDESL